MNVIRLEIYNLSFGKFPEIIPEDEENLFTDPYGGIWMKLTSLVSYILGLFGSLILFGFVAAEWQDLLGPYRTMINQLVSWNYFIAAFYFTFIGGIDLIRALFVALPKSLCSMVLFLKGFIFLSLPLNITAIVIAKYMFICRWKRMKIMQDKLIARIIIIGISGISTFLWSIKSLFQERPVINMIICTGEYYEKTYDDLQFPIEASVVCPCLMVNACLLVPIYAKRSDQVIQAGNRSPKNYDSLTMNFFLIILWVTAVATLVLMNGAPPDRLDEFPFYIYPLYAHFVGPCVGILLIAANIWKKAHHA